MLELAVASGSVAFSTGGIVEQSLIGVMLWFQVSVATEDSPEYCGL